MGGTRLLGRGARRPVALLVRDPDEIHRPYPILVDQLERVALDQLSQERGSLRAGRLGLTLALTLALALTLGLTLSL